MAFYALLVLAPASIVGNNMIPFFWRNMSDEAKLRACRVAVPVIGILSMLIALYFADIYQLCLESWTVLLTSITAPLILGVAWRRTSAVGAAAGAVCGLTAWILMAWLLEDQPVKLAAFVISVAATVAGSLLRPDAAARSTPPVQAVPA